MSKDGRELDEDTKGAYAELRNSLKRTAADKLCLDL